MLISSLSWPNSSSRSTMHGDQMEHSHRYEKSQSSLLSRNELDNPTEDQFAKPKLPYHLWTKALPSTSKSPSCQVLWEWPWTSHWSCEGGPIAFHSHTCPSPQWSCGPSSTGNFLWGFEGDKTGGSDPCNMSCGLSPKWIDPSIPKQNLEEKCSFVRKEVLRSFQLLELGTNSVGSLFCSKNTHREPCVLRRHALDQLIWRNSLAASLTCECRLLDTDCLRLQDSLPWKVQEWAWIFCFPHWYQELHLPQVWTHWTPCPQRALQLMAASEWNGMLVGSSNSYWMKHKDCHSTWLQKEIESWSAEGWSKKTCMGHWLIMVQLSCSKIHTTQLQHWLILQQLTPFKNTALQSLPACQRNIRINSTWQYFKWMKTFQSECVGDFVRSLWLLACQKKFTHQTKTCPDLMARPAPLHETIEPAVNKQI